MTNRRRVDTRRRSGRGQGLVEFAIVLPAIVLVVLGLFDLGRGVFVYNTLAQAARQASRTAMVDQDVTRVKTVAIAAAPSVGLTSTDIDVCFKTSESTLTNCSSPATDDCPQSTRAIGCQAIVTARLSYTPMTPVIGAFWSSISLSSTSITKIEYVCPYDLHPTCP